jgi:hypothetical protein
MTSEAVVLALAGAAAVLVGVELARERADLLAWATLLLAIALIVFRVGA